MPWSYAGLTTGLTIPYTNIHKGDIIKAGNEIAIEKSSAIPNPGFRNINNSISSAISKFTGNIFHSININEHSIAIFHGYVQSS